MNALVRNVAFALRQLRQSPGFALTVILTLAVGIGAATAIFSLVEGILLRPLPFVTPDRLVAVGDHIGGGTTLPITAREIGAYGSQASSFSSLGGYADASFELSGGATPEKVEAARLTAQVFPTLGVQPVLGRVFTVQEENAHQSLAVISYALWLNRYHLDPNVLGKPIGLDRNAYTIVGVMPRKFEFPLQPGRLYQAQLWVPMSLTAEQLSDASAGFWGYHLVARLKDGVTVPQAVQDAGRVSRQVMRGFPAGMSGIHIQGDAKLLSERAIGDARPILRILFMAVFVVLLIACVNAASLLLVRAIRRRRDYAVRLALGARSAILIRESICEGLVLSLAGGLAGLGLAVIAIRASLHLLPESMPRIDSISIDAGVVAFALAVSLVTGILCSIAPAFAALRTNLTESLKDSFRTGTGASSHAWLRSSLVVSEIAIALVLLTASGAFLRSFQKMRAVDPGFRPDHLLAASFQLPLRQYPSHAAVETFNRTVLDRLAPRPGVVSAAITSFLPGTGLWGGSGYTVEGVRDDAWKLQFAMFSFTYGDFFHTLGIPLVEGRDFTLNDRAGAPLVVIVNQSMARHCWPGQSAIGKRIHAGGPKKGYPWATVVGIAGDTKLGARDEPDSDQWYLPALQSAVLFGQDPAGSLDRAAGGYIALRSTLPPEQMIQTVRSTVAGVDPMLALHDVQPMNDVISTTEAPRSFNTDLITAFAMGALLLAITGIYAVVAFSVSLRTQEIAIRMALGAERGRIARLVLVSGARLALIGIVLGVAASLAISRLIASFLFDVSPTDPLIYAAAAAVMMLIALLASALPARRAAAADPIQALRAM